MITREEALALLQASGTERNLMNHALASEAVMRALASRLGADAELWGLTGLLHDLDYPLTAGDISRHGAKGADMLAGRLPEDALHAIRAHNGEMTGVRPEGVLDFALRCGETVTGMISAAALVRPTGMDGMEAKSVRKKMKDKAFAATVNRENIRECERAGLPLDEFLELAVDAVRPLAGELGLLK